MDKETLRFVIVGHVDHGKSTLIGRLFFDTDSLPPDKMEEVRRSSQELGREMEFAFLMDHLEEERAQGITIDTAQAFFRTNSREYVIIDAPGHTEFVKNMITGASQAEAAILIVDADTGMQEQTRRHAYILKMLGIEQVIVILNKMDLSDFAEKTFNKVNGELKEFLGSINIMPRFYIPISATKGDNIAKNSQHMLWYDGPTVLESLDFLENKISTQNKPLILPVQDIYKIDGKRVVVGKIESGVIKKGQKIKVLPQGQTTKVKSIEKFLEKASICRAGENIGIITNEPVFLERGNVICEPDKEPSLTDMFSANIFWMSEEDFSKQESITLRCATQEVSCRVERISKRIDSSTLEVIGKDANVLKNLEVGEITIKTKRPIVVKRFNELGELGRFILVKNENTCAGGIITAI